MSFEVELAAPRTTGNTVAPTLSISSEQTRSTRENDASVGSPPLSATPRSYCCAQCAPSDPTIRL